MLQAVINVDSLMRRRLCAKLQGGFSHLLFAGPARHRSIASHIVDNRDLCLPHLHSTPQLGGPCRNIATTYNMKKTRMVWLHDGENYFEDMITRFDTIHERDRQTDRQTHSHTNAA